MTGYKQDEWTVLVRTELPAFKDGPVPGVGIFWQGNHKPTAHRMANQARNAHRYKKGEGTQRLFPLVVLAPPGESYDDAVQPFRLLRGLET